MNNPHSIIALRFQPIKSRRRRWLFQNKHLLKMNNHLPLHPSPHRISVSWMVCRTKTCICFGCSALPPRFSEFIYCSIATSNNILTCFSYNRIEINNLLEVFVQMSKISFGLCNNLGLRYLHKHLQLVIYFYIIAYCPWLYYHCFVGDLIRPQSPAKSYNAQFIVHNGYITLELFTFFCDFGNAYLVSIQIPPNCDVYNESGIVRYCSFRKHNRNE